MQATVIYDRSVASVLRDNDAARPLSQRLKMLVASDDEREGDLDEWAAERGYVIPQPVA